MVIAKADYYPTFFQQGIRSLFFNIYNTTPVGDYPIITTVVTSDKDKEKYAGMGTVPKLSEWTDERKILGLGPKFDYEIVNKKYEDTIAILRDTLEDEQFGQIRLKIQDLATEVRRAYDEYCFGMLTSGTTLKCFDGNEFFDTAHDNGSGNQSNKLDLAFDKANLQTAISTMRKFHDESKRPLAITPDTLIVNPDLEWSARELLNASSFVATGVGSTAALTPNYNGLQGSLKLVVSPYLTSSTEWYVACTNRSLKPIILQTRVAPEFNALDNPDTSDKTFMSDYFYYGIRTRFGLGYGPWMYCVQGKA